jgi:hypothetical protein
MPPVGFAVADPLHIPLHETFTCDMFAAIADGSVTVTESTYAHPLLSVAVTVYPPAERPMIVSVVAEFDQRKLNGGVPPE